ncbi:hypothetical protein L6164_014117 [Bauhinia variegata]|uniref:Uncharacterized protein n=1 Tax=Bauhinia variegata TaxID=167791 RepID=A0ACB9NG59_BAUVA|nr:hypothetical protein L6164_014117 [Bauhinia variegata]
MCEGRHRHLLCCTSPAKILWHSLKIFLRNKLIFSSIFAFATLPLSSLVFSLSLSTHALRSQIYHLEAVALLAPTRFEARHVWKESRDDAVTLLRIKALFAIPSYVLSLIAAITAVHSTVLAYNGKAPTSHSALNASKNNWKRPSVTTIFTYVILLAFAPLPRILAALTPSHELRFLVLAIGSGIEIYLVAVLSLALVVSIAEDRFGWDAIKVGSGIMEGSRFCGWVLSGLFVLVSGMIRWNLEVLMDSRNLPSELLSSAVAPASKLTELMIGIQDKMGMICLYGLAVLFSYVITAVYYCDCRRRHVIREVEDDGHEGASV